MDLFSVGKLSLPLLNVGVFSQQVQGPPIGIVLDFNEGPHSSYTKSFPQDLDLLYLLRIHLWF